jgi:hypothetical protein
VQRETLLRRSGIPVTLEIGAPDLRSNTACCIASGERITTGWTIITTQG